MVERHQFERRIDWPEEETGRRQLSGTKELGPIDFMWVRTWPEQTLTSIIYGVHMLGLMSLQCSLKPRCPKPHWGWTGGGSLSDFLHHDRYFEALWSLFWIGIRHNSAFSASLSNFKIEQRFLHLNFLCMWQPPSMVFHFWARKGPPGGGWLFVIHCWELYLQLEFDFYSLYEFHWILWWNHTFSKMGIHL